MFIRPFGFVLCLVLCVCCLFGLYRLQAQPQETQPTPAGVSETQSDVEFASDAQSDAFANTMQSDFTRTIIRKNLFAPLGTVLNQTPVPGAHLKLVATVLRENPTHSTALITDATTGNRQHVLAIGEVFGAYQVTEIQPKQVTLDHNGKAVVLRLPSGVLLNAKRR